MGGFYPKEYQDGLNRAESPGEAQQRLAGTIIQISRFFGVRFYNYEEHSLAVAMGAFVRRFPIMRRLGKPTTGG